MIIRDSRIIDPASGVDQIADIRIQGNRIVSVGRPVEAADGEEIIDAAGMVTAPGLVDVHVHFRDPGFTYKEDIGTGAEAAQRGGYTTVVCMANTKPAVDNIETLQYILHQGKSTGIHVLATATVTKGLGGKQLVDMQQLAAAGAAGFTDDGIPIMDEELLRTAMEEAYRLQLPISLHEEDPTLISDNGINRGRVSQTLGLGGSPSEAESTLVKRDLEVACETGAILNIQHISTKEAVEAVRQAKKRSRNIHAEATPHHFSLTEDAILQYGTLAKMNPPLRTEEDRQAILAGLQDGTIDLIATDHAPHSTEEKERPITEAPSGIIGLETALALGITNLVRTGCLTLPELLAKMTICPAQMYGLEAGTIKEGAVADVVIIAENEQWTVEGFASKSENSPFKGMQLYGKVKYTICEGICVYHDT